MNPILIHKGDDTIFADVTKFLTFNIDTALDLEGFKAQFTLAYIEKTIDDISSKSFDVVLTASDTAKLWLGEQNGKLTLFDSVGNIKTIATNIPFLITNDVVENEYQEIDLDIPESSGVDIKLRVGGQGGAVNSVNGMTGDVVIDIPSLDGYVKDTDYATATKAGVFKTDNGLAVTSKGVIAGTETSLENYEKRAYYWVMSKGTLENIKNDLVKRAVTENDIELTEEEKVSAKNWLGYALDSDVEGLATKEELETVTSVIPTTANSDNKLADKGFVNSSIQTSTAHFRGTWKVWADVPSDSSLYPVDAYGNHTPTQNDYLVVVADENNGGGTWRYKYSGLWSELGRKGWLAEYRVNETPLTAEQLAALNSGVTAESLASYVKNTDYATTNKGGTIKAYTQNGFGINNSGQPFSQTVNLASYKNYGGNFFVGKGTLENIKYDLVKDGVVNNNIGLGESDKEKVRNWIGASAEVIQRSSFESLPADRNADRIFQYTGETNKEFTNGYFYKSVAVYERYITNNSDIVTFDFDAFWSELNIAGITKESLRLTDEMYITGGFRIIGTPISETQIRITTINGFSVDVVLNNTVTISQKLLSVGGETSFSYYRAHAYSWMQHNTQPSAKTLLITEDDYNALETKDENTLYLIEE